MKILIVSDTHRKNENLKKVLDREPPFDMMIHLGDAEGSEVIYRKWLPVQTRLIVLKGNNDFFTDAPYERIIELDGCRIFMTHGHRYSLHSGYMALRNEAARRGASIAVYGHSHEPVAEYCKGVLMLNPGSTSWPRQENRKPSYIVLTLEGGKPVSYEIRYLDLDEL